MNRETMIEASDTLIVVDRSARRRRMVIIAAAIGAVLILLAAYAMMRSSDKSAAAAAAADKGGQVPTVTVVVPGRTEVARMVTASGALAARRDEPIGVAGMPLAMKFAA